jgi:gamma-glutamyltranspeptidase/glutathione hydrolase
MGHDIAVAAEPFGGGHCIKIDWQEGTLAGGSDGRKDGAAIGY